MKRIEWTGTHYGRGCPITGDYAVQKVRQAYQRLGCVNVRLVSDEDAAFVSADTKKGDEVFSGDEPDDPYCLDWVSINSASGEAEAVRLWWNLYGFTSSEDEDEDQIWCAGLGPDGIGGFQAPDRG